MLEASWFGERRPEVGVQRETGVAMLFGAHAYLRTNTLANSARPVLQELASATGLTASPGAEPAERTPIRP